MTTKEKFCFGCAKYRPEDEMTTVKRGRGYRAMCQRCLQNASGSWFSKGEQHEVVKKTPK